MDLERCKDCQHLTIESGPRWCAMFEEVPGPPVCPYHPAIVARIKRSAQVTAAIILDDEARQMTGEISLLHLGGLGLNPDSPEVQEAARTLHALVALGLQPANIFAQEVAEMRAKAAGDARKVGRNNPCPCGSGKKYKKCCLNNSLG